MNENERPELGTTEAAVRSCVNLIALATGKSEGQLAYWLDCYYQLRVAHEKAINPFDVSDLMMKVEAPDPVLVKLDELEARIRDLVNELAMQRVKTPSPDSADALTYAASMADTIREAAKRRQFLREALDEAWAKYRKDNPASAFIDQFAEKDDEPSGTPAPAEDVKSTQPAARQMPHDVEAEESERPEPLAAQKKQSSADDGRAAKAAERREGEEADPRPG